MKNISAILEEAQKATGSENLLQLSERVGVAYTTMRAWKDIGQIKLKDLQILADVTGKNIDQLIESEKIKEEPSSYSTSQFEKWGHELRDKWHDPKFPFRGAFKDLMRMTFKPSTFNEIIEWLEKKEGNGQQRGVRRSLTG